ncbi:MAG: double-strand break repair helicase AddA [Alphaproteobacteria bacterium]|nr:double-strand break repair helicase AddA [Alphaproteobacteria bacterium]MDA8012929.1 double-strand break repair helicase AddA [Alphaproteobacteria bacterium]
MESSLERDARARFAAIGSASNVWLSASAGSGKTTVLVDRILRLLLDGAAPERLLCLTYTRAAAAEMVARLAERLSVWAVDEERCAADLNDLLGYPGDDAVRARARRLFFLALDAPGGIRIRTIHAFCRELLSRFPLEAGIVPGFRIFGEDQESNLRGESRFRGLRSGGGDMADAHDAFLTYASESTQKKILDDLWGGSDARLRAIPGHPEDGDGVAARLAALLEWEGDFSIREDSILAGFIAEIPDEAERVAGLMREHGARSESALAEAVVAWFQVDAHERLSDFSYYKEWFLTKGGSARKKPASKKFLTAIGDADAALAEDFFTRETERLLETLESVHRHELIRVSAALALLTRRIRSEYADAKRDKGGLDYNDLITLASRLLQDSDWVRWKLDGGFHHVLIDEAQDTGREQWNLITSLVEDFYAGEGAHEDRDGSSRTLFVVGDRKQSIYSFRGADLESLESFLDKTRARVEGVGAVWRPEFLSMSRRSTSPILSLVNAVFEDRSDGLLGEDEEWREHRPWRAGEAGRVEVLPMVPRPPRRSGGDDKDDDDDGDDDADGEHDAPKSPNRLLAEHLADRIAGWVKSDARPGDEGWLDSKSRPMREGDIMVLFASRQTKVFSLLSRLLKQREVRVAARDRIILADQPAVRDLMILGRALLARDDDLSLAITLKSPLFGFTDKDLLDLSRRVKREGLSSLEKALSESDESRHKEAAALLREYGGRVDRRRPYEFYDRILQEGLRAQLVADLGQDAKEDIERFLNWTLAWERGEEAPSLERFLHDLERDRVERPMQQDPRSDEVRLMTIHGAKGLQAPVVILPQTTRRPKAEHLLWERDDEHGDDESGAWPLWLPDSSRLPHGLEERIEAERLRKHEEYNRLLYVALTRAADRLYVYGIAPRSRKDWDDQWYVRIREGFKRLPGVETFDAGLPWVGDDSDSDGVALRLIKKGDGGERDKKKATEEVAAISGEALTPTWWSEDAPADISEKVWFASSLGADDADRGDGDSDSDSDGDAVSDVRAGSWRALARGEYIHRLLEFLPSVVSGDRARLGHIWLEGRAREFDGGERAEILSSVLEVLERGAPCFVPHGMSEVEIVGRVEVSGEPVLVSGRVDRLVVDAKRVLVVDYKSDRDPPPTAEGVSRRYLVQMAAYRTLLGRMYAGRDVEAALLWTSGPLWMPLPGVLLDSL